jgi:hypothetical protein
MVPVIENVPWWLLLSVHDPLQSKVKYAYCGDPELPDPPPLPPPLPPLLLPPLLLPPELPPAAAGKLPEQPATAQKITTRTIPSIARFLKTDIPHLLYKRQSAAHKPAPADHIKTMICFQVTGFV